MNTAIALPSNAKLSEDDVALIMSQRHGLAENWNLIPQDKLAQIVATFEDAVQPATMDQAKRAAEILLGSYPRNSVDDPQIYSRGIVSVLTKFPPHVGARAVDALTLKTKFLPTRAELNEQCEAIMGELNAARSIAKRMVEEHDRRAKEQREVAERAADRQRFRDKHGDKSPMEVLAAEGFEIGGKTDAETQNKARIKAAKQEAAKRREQQKEN